MMISRLQLSKKDSLAWIYWHFLNFSWRVLLLSFCKLETLLHTHWLLHSCRDWNDDLKASIIIKGQPFVHLLTFPEFLLTSVASIILQAWDTRANWFFHSWLERDNVLMAQIVKKDYLSLDLLVLFWFFYTLSCYFYPSQARETTLFVTKCLNWILFDVQCIVLRCCMWSMGKWTDLQCMKTHITFIFTIIMTRNNWINRRLYWFIGKYSGPFLDIFRLPLWLNQL